MKPLFLILTIIGCISVRAETADVVYNVADIIGQTRVSRANITPLTSPTVAGSSIIVNDRITVGTITDGEFTLTNLVMGMSYRVEFVGPYTSTTITNVFPSTNGTIYAKDYIAANTNNPAGSVAYSMASADIRFQPASTNLTNWSALSTNILSGLGGNYQPASDNLTNWSGLAITVLDSKQPASDNLTNWSALATSSKADTSHNHAAGDVTSGTFTTARLGSGTATEGYVLTAGASGPEWAEATGGGGGSGGPWVALSIVSSEVSIDATDGSQFKLTVTENITLNAPTGGEDGQKITLRIRQDGTGSRTITPAGAWNFGTDITAFSISTNANAFDYITAFYNEATSEWDVVGNVTGY